MNDRFQGTLGDELIEAMGEVLAHRRGEIDLPSRHVSNRPTSRQDAEDLPAVSNEQ